MKEISHKEINFGGNLTFSTTDWEIIERLKDTTGSPGKLRAVEGVVTSAVKVSLTRKVSAVN